MKKLPLIISFILITGCATIRPMEKVTTVYELDFRPFTEQGFFMSPEKYLNDYDPVGIIAVTVWPEVVRRSDMQDRVDYREWISPSGASLQNRYIEILKSSEVIQQAYDAAVNMGADALVDVSIRRVERVYDQGRITGIEVNGFAIKRL